MALYLHTFCTHALVKSHYFISITRVKQCVCVCVCGVYMYVCYILHLLPTFGTYMHARCVCVIVCILLTTFTTSTHTHHCVVQWSCDSHTTLTGGPVAPAGPTGPGFPSCPFSPTLPFEPSSPGPPGGPCQKP